MSVLILGGGSRIAAEVARAYAAVGYPVFVADLDKPVTEPIAADLRTRFGVVAVSGAFDALDYSSHSGFVDQVEEAVGPVEVALLAFGAMGDQERSQSDYGAARTIIDINYTGATSICEVLAERMERRGHGSIVGIASVAGDRGRQSNYFYGSAKGAFALYLQGLRNRLHKSDVHVMTVKLGFVDTRMTFGMKTGIPIASPRQVGQAIYRSQQRKMDTLYYPPFWGLIMGIIKALPEGVFKRLSL